MPQKYSKYYRLVLGYVGIMVICGPEHLFKVAKEEYYMSRSGLMKASLVFRYLIEWSE